MDTSIELFRHQAWADAEHWRTIDAHEAARTDEGLRTRLHHIHLVQHAFLSIVQGEPVTRTSLTDFEAPGALQRYARDAHARAEAFLARTTGERLEELLTIPWFKDPPIQVTVRQALLQAAMHSHYHRGQNAVRLRELGGEPPLTDLLIWYWKGRPAAEWE